MYYCNVYSERSDADFKFSEILLVCSFENDIFILNVFQENQIKK